MSDDGIRDEVNAIGRSAIRELMRQIGIHVPTLAGHKNERYPCHDKFSGIVRYDRNMKPRLVMFNRDINITVLSDHCARCEFQNAHGAHIERQPINALLQIRQLS